MKTEHFLCGLSMLILIQYNLQYMLHFPYIQHIIVYVIIWFLVAYIMRTTCTQYEPSTYLYIKFWKLHFVDFHVLNIERALFFPTFVFSSFFSFSSSFSFLLNYMFVSSRLTTGNSKETETKIICEMWERKLVWNTLTHPPTHSHSFFTHFWDTMSPTI